MCRKGLHAMKSLHKLFLRVGSNWNCFFFVSSAEKMSILSFSVGKLDSGLEKKLYTWRLVGCV